MTSDTTEIDKGNDSTSVAAAGGVTVEQSARAFKSVDFATAESLEASQERGRSTQSAGGMSAEPSALIMDLPVVMKVVLGSAKQALASVTRLAKGSIIKLDKNVGDPVDIFVNGRLIAQGELVVLDEESNRFGVVLTHVGGAKPSGKMAAR